jgi:hypothetical protein
MKKFLNKLDTILEEQTGIAPPPASEQTVEEVGNDLLEIACQLQDTISMHKRSLQDAEMQLQTLMEQLNTKLGWEIRKKHPKLMIAHKGGTCNAGYCSNNLSFKPDLRAKEWNVDGPLSNMFRKQYSQVLPLNNDLGQIADAVVKFFKSRYKTL